MDWRFYDPETGLVHRRQITCPKAQLAANTPSGYVAIRGAFDPLSQRVDITATPPPDADEDWQPPVVDWQPPAPPDTDLVTWTWNAATKRWVAVDTLAGLKARRRQAMAAAWDAERRSGVTVGGKLVPTDADSWTRYLAIKQMADDGGWIDIPIPLADGTFELLTQAKAAALWTALKAQERALLAKLRDKVEAINAASTAAEVAAVTWE